LERKARCYSVPGNVDADALRKQLGANNPGLIVQVAKHGAASNEFCIEMIAAQTGRAAANQNLLARKEEIDLLLRLAGTTQISVAIGRLAPKKGEPFLLIMSGKKERLDRVKPPRGWTRLSRSPLSREDYERIESAALLDAARS
jgi:tRNA threonylcarbamoyladenosine modification (KEOPS) complex Cgi121 subunit